MFDLTFTSSLCLALSSFSRGRTWLRAGDRATRESRKTETAAAVPHCWVSPRGPHASWESPRRSYSSGQVGASEMSSVGKCAKRRDAHMAVHLVAPTEDPGTGGDGRSFSRSGCCFRLHGWIPMAVDGTSAPGAKNFPLPVSPRKRGPRPAFLAHAPAAPKFVAPAGAQRCACPPLASGGSGSVSSSRP